VTLLADRRFYGVDFYVDVPAGWGVPQATNSLASNYVRVSYGSSGGSSGMPVVSGDGPWAVAIPDLDLAENDTVSLVYGSTLASANGRAMAPSEPGVYPFFCRTGDSSAPARSILPSPSLHVVAAAVAPCLAWYGRDGFVRTGAISVGTRFGEGELFRFRVVYRDANGDPPASRNLEIDLDGDGSISHAEAFPMEEIDVSLSSNGRLYGLERAVSRLPGSGVGYRFRFADDDGEATGEPASMHQLVFTHGPAADLSEAVVGPNPFNALDADPGTGSYATGVTFDGLVAGTTVEVYSVSGRMVADLSDEDGDGRIDWRVDEIGPGVYHCVLTGGAQTRVVNVAVLK
jgi:hypothetical protein